MTVRLEISYDATDGSVPSNVAVEWDTDTHAPTSDAIIGIIDGVARIAERSRVSYAVLNRDEPEPATNAGTASGFRAYTDIKAGHVCCLRAGSQTDVVPIGLGDSPTREFNAVAVEDIAAGESMVFAAAPSGDKHVWRRAEA